MQALTQESLAETPVAGNGLAWLFVTVVGVEVDPEPEPAIVTIDDKDDSYYSFFHRQGVDYELPSIQ